MLIHIASLLLALLRLPIQPHAFRHARRNVERRKSIMAPVKSDAAELGSGTCGNPAINTGSAASLPPAASWMKSPETTAPEL